MAEFTDDDRLMLRQMRDALVGTIERKGLLHVVEDHVNPEVNADPHGVIELHLEEMPHVSDRRNGHTPSWRRLGFSVVEKIVTAVVLTVLAWAAVVFGLGLKVVDAAGAR